MTPSLALELPAFLFGLLFGSFLNVCISRLPAHESLAKPRSHCPQCGTTIRWYDNVPLLSWILLAARCRECKAPIPWRYPLVELAFGLWCAVAATRLAHWLAVPQPADSLPGLVIDLIAFTIAGFLLLGLMVMDWQTQTLPDAFTLFGILLGFLLVCVQAVFLAPGQGDIHLSPRSNLRLSSPGSSVAKGDVFLTGPEHLVLGRLLAICAAAGLLLLIRAAYSALRHREGMGLGDAKLLAMIAAFMGFAPAMLALFAGVILCTVYALVLLARRRADLASRLPLGSFLAAGGLLTAIAGEALLTWYKGLL